VEANLTGAGHGRGDPPPWPAVFDLDGCLIDSEPLIRAAYCEAGHEPPPGFLAFGHHDWIPRRERRRVHAAKDAAYLALLHEMPVTYLPPWRAAELAADAGQQTAVITGAPRGTLAALGFYAPSWPFTVGTDGLSSYRKERWLAAAGRRGWYVDDQEYVRMPPGWRLIRYTGQTAPELVRLVRECP
jgi:hypothetical protein